MSVRETIALYQAAMIDKIAYYMELIAKLFGFPGNPGMPVYNEARLDAFNYYSRLPSRNPFASRAADMRPDNMFETIFGSIPKADIVHKFLYESKADGFYNFYIKNYKNIYFLPDSVSEYIQIRLNVCLDTTQLEIIREAIFIFIFTFGKLLEWRLSLFWYMTINPYTRPWVYLIAMTDWTQDILAGFSPTIFGIDIMPTLVAGLIGKIADNLNHLVFTMPFLPSEAQKARIKVPGGYEDILVFRYFPYLWFKHPIPNEIREFWYNQRPEILRFMQKNYGHLGIPLLPDRLLNESFQSQHSISDSISNIKSMTVQVFSLIDFNDVSFINYLIFLKHLLYHFLLTYFDNLIKLSK